MTRAMSVVRQSTQPRDLTKLARGYAPTNSPQFFHRLYLTHERGPHRLAPADPLHKVRYITSSADSISSSKCSGDRELAWSAGPIFKPQRPTSASILTSLSRIN